MKAFLWVICALAVYLLDITTHYTKFIHQSLSYMATPMVWIVDKSIQQSSNIYARTKKQDLLQENELLRQERLTLYQSLRQFQAVVDENQALRKLLNGMERAHLKGQMAHVRAVSGQPYVRSFTIDKGQANGISEGDAVVDTDGVVGQIVKVYPHEAKIMLLVDNQSGIPVYNERNHIRAIAMGVGKDELELINVPKQQDVKIGDKYVASALGYRYPFGYPVGEVTHIDKQVGSGFAKIFLKPSSQFIRSHLVFVIGQSSKGQST